MGMRQEAEAEKIRQQNEKPQGFEFTYMDIADPKQFPNFKTKECQDKFFQWGIQDNLDVAKFRFNKSFHLIGAEEFLKDLFNDANVIKNFAALNGLGAGTVNNVEFTSFNCNVMNMQFFDVFKE